MSLWEDIQSDIGRHVDRVVRAPAPDSVGGGCINQTYRLRSDGGDFFIKLNEASGLDMFEAEAQGLEELGQADGLRVPRPVCWGCSGGRSYLVMESLDLDGRGDPARLGEGLAALHRITGGQFGWHRDNTIGSTPQINRQEEDWQRFWREHRLGYQLQLAARNGAGTRVVDAGRRVQEALPALLAGHAPAASLLHGDLWSGNYSFTRAGEPAIFDPAVYYGDREADLAMTELFGGFDRRFYSAYQASWPLDDGYPVRKVLYNLYHVLNHFNLFGGGYLSQARNMMERL
ncbi:MAG: fructosamine kinase family protein, partial [Gammaproteobacteria bacterium]